MVETGGVAPDLSWRSAHIQQFFKFGIIGATSTVIDFSIMNVLYQKFGINWVFASTISFVFAVTNGFIWNSIWTFRGMGSGKRHEQYVKFVAVNVIGWVLNLIIMTVIIYLLTGEITRVGPGVHTHIKPGFINIAKLIAVVFVSIWNFVANRKWTFK